MNKNDDVSRMLRFMSNFISFLFVVWIFLLIFLLVMSFVNILNDESKQRCGDLTHLECAIRDCKARGGEYVLVEQNNHHTSNYCSGVDR